MAKAPVLSEILKWSVAERLELIGKVWDSIAKPDDVPMPEWHKEELDRRLEDDDANPDEGMSLEEFQDSLAKRR